MFKLDRADWKKVQRGSRIVVRYADKNWYACKVLKENDRSGKVSPSNFLVKYDDGSTEWTNLARSDFKWQDFYAATDDEGGDEGFQDRSDDEESVGSEEEEEEGSLGDDVNGPEFIDDEAIEVNEEESEESAPEDMKEEERNEESGNSKGTKATKRKTRSPKSSAKQIEEDAASDTTPNMDSEEDEELPSKKISRKSS